MIDQNIICNNSKLVTEKLSHRGFNLDLENFYLIEKKRKTLQCEIDKLRFERKKKSNLIKEKKSEEKNVAVLSKEVLIIKKKLILLEKQLKIIKNAITQYLIVIPNIPSDDVPTGINDKEISYWGTKNTMNFPILDHVEIGKQKNEIDFVSGVKLAGSRFVVIKGQIAMMYRALIQFMIDVHTEEHGYLEVLVPYLANEDSLYGTGHLPKFHSELFYTNVLETKKKLALIPTAEVPITNLMRNKTLKENNLPIKFISCTPCFRSEAGSYGQDTQGLIRMHQFDKVELVHFVKQEDSIKSLIELVGHAEKILQLLNLHYRKILLCANNMSFGSAKTYDLEVWLPSKKNYKEVSSCSNMSDFQSRRIKAFYSRNKGNTKKLLHILNGSGLAVGRTLVAILENYQQPNGSIKIPKVLRPYMKELKFIG